MLKNNNAKEYVETDEEEEEEPFSPQNEVEEVATLDPPKVEKEIPAKRVRKKKEIFQGVEEAPPQPVPQEEPKKEPVKRRPKKPVSKQQLDHLAKARVKALEAKKKKKEERLKNPTLEPNKPKPMYSVSNIAREFKDEDVDKLIDSYKQRRKAKKAAKKVEEDTRKLIQSHHSIGEAPAKTNYTMSDFF
eukprot:SAG11_NODE_10230_length_845_cov_1.615282_1_plen_189_part_00